MNKWGIIVYTIGNISVTREREGVVLHSKYLKRKPLQNKDTVRRKGRSHTDSKVPPLREYGRLRRIRIDY